MSLVARWLSHRLDKLFCYNAISSAGIVAILPGYLVLTASLELGAKNMVCGSVKLVWALVYTLFLGFGLQLGSDAYLALSADHRAALAALSTGATPAPELVGSFRSADPAKYAHFPAGGQIMYTNASAPVLLAAETWVNGCLRAAEAPWYASPVPWWAAFALVPAFAAVNSVLLAQPARREAFPVMVVIACAAYAANAAADRWLFDQGDVVSAVGALVCGLLGHAYARWRATSAFVVMVPGVLFLVPSGLSAAGGITAEPDVIDIGGAMIKVSIGITVGLFMSGAIVAIFAAGGKKRAGVMSF